MRLQYSRRDLRHDPIHPLDIIIPMESFVQLDASSDDAASDDEDDDTSQLRTAFGNDDQHQPSNHHAATTPAYDGPSIELRLHEEVLDLVDAFRPTNRERALRAAAVANLAAVVRTLWKAARVHTFGSFDTGVFLPSSDVDLVVMNAGGASKPHQVAGLRQIEWALREKNVGHSLELISKAKVPIVKYIDVETGVPVDVCLEQKDGIVSSAFAKKALAKFPAFRHLTLLLKMWLRERGLNDTFTGGVGSFLLQLLVVSTLQHPPRASNPALRGNLGALLLHFFETFGLRFNYCDVGLRVDQGGSYYSKHRRGWYDGGRPYLLSVESPLDATFDVAAASFNIRSVRRAFGHAYFALLAADVELKQSRSFDRDQQGLLTGGATAADARLHLLSALLADVEVHMAERFRLHARERAEEGLGARPGVTTAAAAAVAAAASGGGRKRPRDGATDDAPRVDDHHDLGASSDSEDNGESGFESEESSVSGEYYFDDDSVEGDKSEIGGSSSYAKRAKVAGGGHGGARRLGNQDALAEEKERGKEQRATVAKEKQQVAGSGERREAQLAAGVPKIGRGEKRKALQRARRAERGGGKKKGGKGGASAPEAQLAAGVPKNGREKKKKKSSQPSRTLVPLKGTSRRIR